MSYSLIRDSFPVARKAHRCIWCGEVIPIGLKHRHEISVFDGAWQDHRWHTECDKDARDYFWQGEETFSRYENERPAGVERALRTAGVERAGGRFGFAGG